MDRIIFMGSDPIALPVLAMLQEHKDVDLLGVYTQPDRRVGRGKKIQANAVKLWAEPLGLWVRQPEKLGREDIDFVQEQGVDWVVVMAYGHLLKPALLDAVSGGFWNLHTSLLPKYRGAAPIQAALWQGDEETGVSLMKIVPAMDAGPVLDQERVAIAVQDNAGSLWQSLSEAAARLLQRNVSVLVAGDGVLQEQDEGGVSRVRKIEKQDGCLDFAYSAEEVLNHMRALDPWPGSFFDCGDVRIKVGRAEVLPPQGGDMQVGTLRQDGGRVLLRCAGGDLSLLTLQRPGGKMLAVADFLRGFALPASLRLSRPQRPALVC